GRQSPFRLASPRGNRDRGQDREVGLTRLRDRSPGVESRREHLGGEDVERPIERGDIPLCRVGTTAHRPHLTATAHLVESARGEGVNQHPSPRAVVSVLTAAEIAKYSRERC